MDNSAFKKFNSEKSFNDIFKFKGEIAPIAEKSRRNFELKIKNPVNREQRLHYFAIGHTFKQLDKEKIFKFELDEELREKQAKQFIALQEFKQPIIDAISNTISNVRNINSHYVHDFEKIRVDTIDATIIDFLKQSFELAVIQIYLKENETNYLDFIATQNPDKALVGFLCDKFYSLDKKKDYSLTDGQIAYKAASDKFRLLSKDEAIEALLFVEVEREFDWMLYDTHAVFNITAGRYLSFYACLFLLSMFLYKSEANQLIAKIKGFKKNKEKEEKSKREIFSFFSKRFSSQDIDSEENNLVKFRDIIQYLNRYPLAWNKDLELESLNPQMTDKLKAKIIEMEINRSFANDTNKYASNPRFHAYAQLRIWNNPAIQNDFTTEEKREFAYAINTNAILKNAQIELSNLEAKYQKSGNYNDKKAISDQNRKIDKLKTANEPNRILEKLKKRVANNLLFTSYGRNQDRFMDIATRFLAESNFFGNEAKFKTYLFFTTKEQEVDMALQKELLTKKKFDNLKFHQGKRIDYITFADHLKKYPSWDTPFVIENNAIQIKLNLGSGIEKIVSIQRGLMIYLLEVALYSSNTKIIANVGKTLLIDYFTHQQAKFNAYRAVIVQNSSITAEEKKSFKKLLPKRLLNHYVPAIQNHLPESTTLELFLEKTKLSEARYNDLLEKARKEGNYDDFVKRNKGKQFKLQFVRKAWHLMYFKDSYTAQVAVAGHHKRFHIERDEFNNFSRYMFAFDEVPSYKIYLTEMLTTKGFFENTQFKTLYDNGHSLEDFYTKTKSAFEGWLAVQANKQPDANKYTLGNYQPMFDDAMFYINISHFIEYLKSVGKITLTEEGKLKFKVLENTQYLIKEYYYTDTIAKEEIKSCGKLYNKLNAARLEDALLFEIGMRYFASDEHIINKAKGNVLEILNQNIEFDIKDANNNHQYKLIVPFNKIESYVALLQHKKEQDESKFKSSFLPNLAEYIEKVRFEKDIKSIYEKYIENPPHKVLTYDELGKIDSHLIGSSIRFTNLALSLEHYFIYKNKIKISSNNRIVYNEIEEYLISYFSKDDRDNAFHFDIPVLSYQQQTRKIEKEFIKNELHPISPMSYQELSWPKKSICNILLKTLHNDFYGREKDGEKKKKEAENRFFNDIICR